MSDISQVVAEIELKYAQSKADLQNVQAQIATRQKDVKLMDVTQQQLKEHVQDESATVWQGMGKMFLSTDLKSHLEDLATQKKEALEQIANLKKKEEYLDKTYKNLTSALVELVSKTEKASIN